MTTHIKARGGPKQECERLKVAIACSGLGHVRRGVEAWAEDLAGALGRRGVDVTLYAAGESSTAPATVLRCLRRSSPAAQAAARIFSRLGGWRYGLGSDYEVEQTTFSFFLWLRIRRRHDVLHVQDPLIARIMDQLFRLGLSKPRVVFANGTAESTSKLKRYSVLHLLTPDAARAWASQKPASQLTFTIPNFTNAAKFMPGDKQSARRQFDLPESGPIVLCVAAINSFHKRIDHLLREFTARSSSRGDNALLLIAGGREAETAELMELGRKLLGDSVRFLVDVPRAQVPALYAAADLFVLPSLYETFGIVLIEAMASGLPILCHDTESFRYIAGPAGMFVNMAAKGAAAAALTAMLDPTTREPLAAAARDQIIRNFSEPVVIDQIMAMYCQLVGGTQMAGAD